MRRVAPTLLMALLATTTVAQVNPEAQDPHHPPGATGAASPASASPSPEQGALDEQMRRMHDMHARMQQAKTPRERQALMDEQMKLMQSGMDMMARMDHGPMAGGMMGGPQAGMQGGETPGTMQRGMGGPAAPGAQGGPQGGAMGGMPGMMGMHGDAERRMAMMEMMMQMMVDREAAAGRK